MNVATAVNQPAQRDLVVAFIAGHPKAGLLLRSAYKIAQEIGGRWRVVYVETPDTQKKSSSYQQILNLLTRAKQMGAEIEHIHALSVPKGAEAFLLRESPHINTVIIGSTNHKNRLLNFLRAPEWLKLVQLASHHVRVETVPLAGHFIEPWYRRAINRMLAIEPSHLLSGALSMMIPFMLASLLRWAAAPVFFRINEQNIDNLFLITAAIVAGRFGIVPGVVSAIVGFFINNYYFTLPYYHLKLNGSSDWFSMGLFLSAAVFISLFTGRMREYTNRLKKRELYSEMLFTLYRLASESFSRQQAIETLQQNLESMLNADVAFFLPHAIKSTSLETAAPAHLRLSDNDKKALEACWNDMKCTGIASPYNPGTAWRFEPMICANGEMGVVGARVRNPKQLDVWFGRLLTAAADQTAAILAHIELENSMEATRISQEREKLRVMLLSSVSHDLKTPLAGIIGALSACQTLSTRIKPAQQHELIAGSLEEAQRLDSFITNILDMTKLETGNIKFRLDWHAIKNMTLQVTERMDHRLKQRKINFIWPDQDVEAYMDDLMIGQVLQNLIDNACKYTPAKSDIDITWEISDGGVICYVRDHGPGIPPDKLQTVFNKYTRLEKQDMQAAGTGLGLAISKAILEAQNGWIKADNHPQGGAVFSFCLPEWRPLQPAEAGKERHYAAI